MGITYCQDLVTDLMDLEPQEDVNVNMSIDTIPSDSTFSVRDDAVTDTIMISTENSAMKTSVPGSLTCFECIDCHLKPAFNVRNCDTGVTMCFVSQIVLLCSILKYLIDSSLFLKKMHKIIKNVSRLVRRGCSTSKGMCTAPDDDQSNSFDSITCCKSHTCNHTTQVKLSFSLSTLILFIMLITIINM